MEEALQRQSKKDFISKLSISSKKAKEAHCWLRLLRDDKYIQNKYANVTTCKAEELITMLTAIIKTSKKNMMKA